MISSLSKVKKRRKKMVWTNGKKRVFCQGAYDLLNWGHIKQFEAAKLASGYRFDGYVIVGLNSDELIRQYKHREPILPFWQRKAILEAISYIDEVVEINSFSPLQFLKDNNIDIYVLGEEWKNTKTEEIAFMESKKGLVIYTPEYEGVIRSTEIRKRCATQYLAGIGWGG